MNHCEMDLCIYNNSQKQKCTLQTIHLDQNGLCQSCIMPIIPQDFLEHLKKKLLQKLHSKD